MSPALKTRKKISFKSTVPCVGCGEGPTAPVQGIHVCQRCAQTAAGRIERLPGADELCFDSHEVAKRVRQDLARTRPHSAAFTVRSSRRNSRRASKS